MRLKELVAVLALAGVASPLTAQAARTPTTSQDFRRRYAEVVDSKGHMDEGKRLHKLLAVDWEYVMTEFPEFATFVGYPGQNNRWTDNSLDAIERRKRELRERLRAIETIDRSKLSASDQ